MVCRKYDFNMNICTYTGKQCFNKQLQDKCAFFEKKQSTLEERIAELEKEVDKLKGNSWTRTWIGTTNNVVYR